MTQACRNVAPKTKRKRKNEVANERFKKNMSKTKWSKSFDFNRIIWSLATPALAHSVTLPIFGQKFHAGRATKRLWMLSWTVCCECLWFLNSWIIKIHLTRFHVRSRNCVFVRFEALSTHACLQKRPLNDVVPRVVCSTNVFLLLCVLLYGALWKHAILMRWFWKKRHAAQATITCL